MWVLTQGLAGILNSTPYFERNKMDSIDLAGTIIFCTIVVCGLIAYGLYLWSERK